MAKRYFVLIGIILFALILWNLNLNKIGSILLSVNPFFLILSIILTFVAMALKGLKWQFLIKAHGFNCGLIDCIKIFSIGFVLGIVTPGRIGDLGRAAYLKKYKVSFSKSLSTVIVDRLIDIGVLILFGFVSIVVFAYLFNTAIIPFFVVVIVVIAFIALLTIFLKQNLAKRFLKPFYKISPKKFRQALFETFYSFYSALNEAKKNKKMVLAAILLGFFIWFFSVFVSLIMLFALNIFSISFYFMILVIAIITLLEILPISISGIGTRDAALIFLFSFYAILPEQAIAYSLIYLVVGYVIAAIPGIIWFMKNPIDLKSLSNKMSENK